MNDYTSNSSPCDATNINIGAGAGAAPQPPSNNMGVGDVNVASDGGGKASLFGVDWISLTLYCSLEAALVYAAFLGLRDGLTPLGHGGGGFKTIYLGLHGFQIYADPVSNQEFISFRLPGKVCAHVGAEKLADLIGRLYDDETRWECSRLDLAFDTQAFTVGAVYEAYKSGLIETKAGTFEHILKEKRRGVVHGETFYIGSRQSTALLRVYTKLVEGHGVYGSDAFTRVELELHEARASMALSALAAVDLSEWSALAARWLTGFVRVKADWWVSWLGAVESMWLRLKRRVPTVDRVRTWLYNQVAPSLAVYFAGLSHGDMDVMHNLLIDLMQSGRLRWKPLHEALVAGCRPAEPEQYAVFSF